MADAAYLIESAGENGQMDKVRILMREMEKKVEELLSALAREK
jgi:hypothetical protein